MAKLKPTRFLMASPKRVFISFPVKPDFEAKLNAMAARKNISRAALMRLAASEYLEREERKAENG